MDLICPKCKRILISLCARNKDCKAEDLIDGTVECSCGEVIDCTKKKSNI